MQYHRMVEPHFAPLTIGMGVALLLLSRLRARQYRRSLHPRESAERTAVVAFRTPGGDLTPIASQPGAACL